MLAADMIGITQIEGFLKRSPEIGDHPEKALSNPLKILAKP